MKLALYINKTINRQADRQTGMQADRQIDSTCTVNVCFPEQSTIQRGCTCTVKFTNCFLHFLDIQHNIPLAHL